MPYRTLSPKHENMCVRAIVVIRSIILVVVAFIVDAVAAAAAAPRVFVCVCVHLIGVQSIKLRVWIALIYRASSVPCRAAHFPTLNIFLRWARARASERSVRARSFNITM